ncbi:autoinducer binding domain-containing protein [Rhizobium sp. 16-449-1b]|uniref:helix-turn-helix transcriptional regulator n=1 Tax=Rhizobium sp. 16-449-1b TaxID=2819989 RepID=UPI001ADB47A0|nr:autoinducer binding domain-containing protein [Rhizobium sp. 16-449-1b]MBO9198375.1 autoinducer binding domain-containing protein [Rhizobium sp. 16-449-1b]
MLDVTNITEFVDMRSVPPIRPLRENAFIARMRLAVQFDRIAVSGLDLPPFEIGAYRSIDTDFPLSFMEAYSAERHHLTDPLYIVGLHSIEPVIDAEARRQFPLTDRLAQLLEFHDIHNRVFFPLRRGELMFAAVTVARATPFSADEVDTLKVLSPVIHFEITKELMQRFAAQTLKLTEGELLCLRLSSLGMTSEQIGLKSGYQTETVNTYLKIATRKLDSKNRTHAVAEAIRRKLIG